MDEYTRRYFLKNTGAVTAGISLSILKASAKTTNIQIEDISHGYEEYLFRTPNKFAGTAVDRATIMTVKCSIRLITISRNAYSHAPESAPSTTTFVLADDRGRFRMDF
jgi:hypothetical protein